MSDRLKQLADALSVPCGAVIRVEDIDAAAALLRAASAETVGTEWGSIQHTSEHNADLHAARLAIADLKEKLSARESIIAAYNRDSVISLAITERDAAITKLSAIENAVRFRSDATANLVGDIIAGKPNPPVKLDGSTTFGPGCSPHPLDEMPNVAATPKSSPAESKCCSDCDPVFRAAYGLDEQPKPAAEAKADDVDPMSLLNIAIRLAPAVVHLGNAMDLDNDDFAAACIQSARAFVSSARKAGES